MEVTQLHSTYPLLLPRKKPILALKAVQLILLKYKRLEVLEYRNALFIMVPLHVSDF